MGSFNVACGISGVPLREGDRVGLQVLAPGDRHSRHRVEAICTDSTREFRLVSLPVYGTYNGYGSIEKVEDTPGLHLLERLLNRPMSQELLKLITEGRSFYQSSGTFAKLYFKPEVKLADAEASAHEKLVSLGFTHQSVSESQGEYTLGSGKILTETVDGVLRSKEIVCQRGAEEYGCSLGSGLSSLLERFAQLTGDYPGVAAEDTEAVRCLSTITAMFFAPSVHGSVAKVLRDDNFQRVMFERFSTDWADAAIIMKTVPQTLGEKFDQYSKLNNNRAVEDICKRLSDRNVISSMQDLEANESYWFVEFPLIMEEVGRFFAPSAYLSDSSGSAAFEAIRLAADDILAAHRARFEEEDCDDE